MMFTILIALSASLLAQQTGSIVGSVLDKTGAVVPKSKVTLTNAATKDVRTTITNAEGFFSFSGVVTGDFSVRVDSKGFRPAEQTSVHVSPGDRRNVAVTLEVASEDASIVVTASTSAVTVDSGDLSSTVDSGDIAKLALTGRDVTELIKTLPGFNQFTNFGGMQNKANYDSTVTSIQSAVGNGINTVGAPSRAGGADLTTDGTHIIDPGCNCNATQSVNPDMTAEVKVTSSAYGADQQTGPVVIAAVGKSGSSTYHGAAYMHFRDGSLNSTDWFVHHVDAVDAATSNKPIAAKPFERYWYPGGQIGGPIPYTRKKIVAFAGFEKYNQTYPDGQVKANVPTLNERAGKFDPTLADNAAACKAMSTSVSGSMRCQNFTVIGSTTNPIVNDDISAYIGGGAKALLNEIPVPNRTPTSDLDFNVVKSVANTVNGYMFHSRVDFDIDANTKLYVSYNQQHDLYGSPFMRWWVAGNAVDYPGGDFTSDNSKTLSGNLVKVFNASTTNEFLANVSYLDSPNTLSNEKLVDKTATKYPYSFPSTSKILPSIINTWWNNDFGIPMQMDTGRSAYFIHKVQPSVSDNLTKIFKTHTAKIGVSWYNVHDKEASFDEQSGPNGTIGYGPAWGLANSAFGLDPVLNFMTDFSGSYKVQPVTSPDMKGYSAGLYATDDWKANRKLTLTLGLRVVHDTPYTDATGVFGVPAWTQTWYNTDVAAGITNQPGMRWHGSDLLAGGMHSDPSVPLGGHSMNKFFYQPRFGVAYDVFGTAKTVVRGGFGVYYYRDGLGGSAGTSTPMGGTMCQTTNSMSNSYLSQINAATITCAGSTNGVTSGNAQDPNDHTEPLNLTYNFTISQQTTAKTVLELSYVGNQTSDLINPITGAMNAQVPIGAYMKPDPNKASKYYGQILPLNASTTADSNATASNNKQDYVPFVNYSSLGLINHGSWANYNAFMASWTKRQGSLTYNLNYTFSKTMGIAGNSIDPINIHNDYTVSNSDRTHVLNASYAYEVGQRFKNKLVGAGLNGWMVSGITSLQSGPPIQQSWSYNMGLGGTNGSPDLSGTDPNGKAVDFGTNTISNSVYLGTPSYTLFPKLTCNPGSGLKKGQYANAGCFALPTAPTFNSATGVLTGLGGDGQIHMPYFRGPKYMNTDLAASRTVKITENQNAQIKFSATNFLNHPLTSFDSSNGQNLNLTYTKGVLATTGNANGGTWLFGIPNEKFGRRVLEMSVRYNF